MYRRWVKAISSVQLLAMLLGILVPLASNLPHAQAQTTETEAPSSALSEIEMPTASVRTTPLVTSDPQTLAIEEALGGIVSPQDLMYLPSSPKSLQFVGQSSDRGFPSQLSVEATTPDSQIQPQGDVLESLVPTVDLPIPPDPLANLPFDETQSEVIPQFDGTGTSHNVTSTGKQQTTIAHFSSSRAVRADKPLVQPVTPQATTGISRIIVPGGDTILDVSRKNQVVSVPASNPSPADTNALSPTRAWSPGSFPAPSESTVVSDTILLVEPISEPSESPPNIFFSTTIAYDYAGEIVSLSSTPDGTGLLSTDDAIYFAVQQSNGIVQYYYFDYSLGGSGTVTSTLPVNVSHLFSPGLNTIYLELWDYWEPHRGTLGYYLVSGGSCDDVTPPIIGPVTLEQTGRLLELGGSSGYAIVSAFVTDDSGVALTLDFNGQIVPMYNYGGGYYVAAVPYPVGQTNMYTISAVDGCNNNATFPTFSAYGSETEDLGYWPCRKECHDMGYQRASNDPVNTANGNFYYQNSDLSVMGVGETDLVVERTYNARAMLWNGATEMQYVADGNGGYIEEPVSQPPQPFGPGWTFPFATYLQEIDAAPFYQGAQIQYADGHTASFTWQDDHYVADSPSNFDTLTKEGDEFVLRHKYTLEVERFDAQGRLIARADRNGNPISLEYNGDLLTRVENGSGRWLTFTYDEQDRVIQIDAPENKSISYGYTDGLLTSFTDARGETTTYGYDDNQLLTQIVTPKGHTSLEQTYDDEYRVEWQRIGRAEINTFAYSDDGLTTTITDSYGNETTYRYNDLGQNVEIIDARGYSELFGYDADYNRTYYKDREGREWLYTYDDRGNWLTEDGPLSWHREWDYNDLNRVTRAQDASGRDTHYEYDAQGNLIRIERPGGTFSEIVYDGRGLPVDVYDYAGTHTHNEYDPDTGDLLFTTDGAGHTTGYTYDALGRLTETEYPTGAIWSYAYDGRDNITDVYGPIGYHLHYDYDANNNLEREVDANGGEITYQYDASEMLVQWTNQLGFDTTFIYDDMNNLIRQEDAAGYVWTF